MDYENFCSLILKSDPKIRLAVVYDQWAKRAGGGMREGITSLLSDHMEKELVSLSVIDWQARKEMSKVLGKTKYTLAYYDKVKIFSFYLGDDYLLLVTTETDSNTDKIVGQVIEIYHKVA